MALPPIHAWPPLFTLQPALATRATQLQVWSDIVRKYAESVKLCAIDVAAGADLPVFRNDSISRRLSQDGVAAVLQHMVDTGYGEWVDKQHSRMLVLWRKVSEWADVLYKYVCDSGMTSSVYTIYELVSSNDHKSQPFHGISTELLVRIVRALEDEGKARLFSSSGQDGVKFVRV